MQHGVPLGVKPKKVELLRNSSALGPKETRPKDQRVYLFLKEEISKELKAGRMAGPFDEPPFEPFFVNPMFGIPKNSDPDCKKFRRIDHLSWPRNKSINDTIDKELFPVEFPTFDQIAESIWELGKDCLLSKQDLKDAYKQIRLHPQDWKYTGIKFDGKYYFSAYLVFGATCAPGVFERHSSLTEWSLKKRDVGQIFHYIDDFLLLSQPGNFKLAQQRLENFKRVVVGLGWSLKKEKEESMTTKLTYLGIEINTHEMTFSIPQRKLDSIVMEVQKILEKPKVSLKQLRSILGKLCFVAKCVWAGRAFLRRLFDFLKVLLRRERHKKFRLPAGAIKDLKWWLQHARNFNGIIPIPQRNPEKIVHIYTDACLAGGAGIFAPEWFYVDLDCEQETIAPKEFRMVLVALETWGESWTGLPVEFHVDNQNVVHVCNKQTSESPILMNFLQNFLMKVAQFSIAEVKFKYINTKDNFLADALSRKNFSVVQEPRYNLNWYPTATSELLLHEF